VSVEGSIGRNGLSISFAVPVQLITRTHRGKHCPYDSKWTVTSEPGE
jgi:hypothetical protein